MRGVSSGVLGLVDLAMEVVDLVALEFELAGGAGHRRGTFVAHGVDLDVAQQPRFKLDGEFG